METLPTQPTLPVHFPGEEPPSLPQKCTWRRRLRRELKINFRLSLEKSLNPDKVHRSSDDRVPGVATHVLAVP
ncbi:hypothetical protein TNCV_3357461 [Trichonephila clavipes]|nr:hypothetical protein TNCV_3357461 [Trichonephila clavipes]